MPTFKITIAYDGTHYYGWQTQHNKPTVAQTLRDVCARIFNEDVKVIGVSRTDAGVHARGQVATVRLTRSIAARSLQFAWNNALPADIRITACTEVEPYHNPFQNIDYKEYHYHIMTAQALPFYVRYGWHMKRPFDCAYLNEILQVFVGTHDFRSFCTDQEDDADTHRTVDSIVTESLPAFSAYRIVVKGHSFLRYMIRRMIGAAVEIVLDPARSKQELATALAQPNARQRFFKAPAQGLTLHRIVYKHCTQEDYDDKKNFLV